jgi:hypothetical protein
MFPRDTEAPEAPSTKTLARASRVVYPLDVHRKGVAKWSLLLVCVWLCHSNMQKQGRTQDLVIFLGVIPAAVVSELFGAEICISVSSHSGCESCACK